jgi:hypothetical protein
MSFSGPQGSRTTGQPVLHRGSPLPAGTVQPNGGAKASQTPLISDDIYTGVTNGYRLKWRADDLQVAPVDSPSGRPTFSVRARQVARCHSDSGGNDARGGHHNGLGDVAHQGFRNMVPVSGRRLPPQFCDGTRQTFARPTAQVGRYLSIKEYDSSSIPSYVPGDSTYLSHHYLQTMDMATGKPVALTDIFRERDVLNALLKDPLIKDALSDPAVAGRLRGRTPGSLAELNQALAGWVPDSGRYCFERLGEFFSFHHVARGQVAVRISLPPGDDRWQSTMTQIQVDLPIPKHLERDFDRATKAVGNGDKSGFLGQEAEKRFNDRTTYFRFEAPL